MWHVLACCAYGSDAVCGALQCSRVLCVRMYLGPIGRLVGAMAGRAARARDESASYDEPSYEYTYESEPEDTETVKKKAPQREHGEQEDEKASSVDYGGSEDERPHRPEDATEAKPKEREPARVPPENPQKVKKDQGADEDFSLVSDREEGDGTGIYCRICGKYIKDNSAWAIREPQKYSARCRKARGEKDLRKPCEKCGKWVVDCAMSWAQHEYTCKHGGKKAAGNRKETRSPLPRRKIDLVSRSQLRGRSPSEPVMRKPAEKKEKVKAIAPWRMGANEQPPLARKRPAAEVDEDRRDRGLAPRRREDAGSSASGGGNAGSECARVGCFLESIAHFLKSG